MFKTEFVSGNDDFKTDFTPGNNGMSAYELWLEQGNKGTEQDFLDSLRGDKGDTGENGYTPVKGTDYFTQNDVAEMVAAVKNQLVVEQWTFTLLDDTVVTKDVVME